MVFVWVRRTPSLKIQSIVEQLPKYVSTIFVTIAYTPVCVRNGVQDGLSFFSGRLKDHSEKRESKSTFVVADQKLRMI